MANLRVRTGKKWGRANKTAALRDSESVNPEHIAMIKNVSLKGEPDLITAIMQIAEMSGHKTAPEVIRHVLRIGVSVTPMDGEVRAAIINVKSRMTQYLGKLFWGKVAEMMVEFENQWTPAIVLAAIEQEMARIRMEREGATPNV